MTDKKIVNRTGWEATISGDLCAIQAPTFDNNIIEVSTLTESFETLFSWSLPKADTSILIADPFEFDGVAFLRIVFDNPTYSPKDLWDDPDYDISLIEIAA